MTTKTGKTTDDQIALPLNEQQRQRVAALHHARAVLAQRSFGGASGAVEPTDLVSVADWILSGQDPRTRPRVLMENPE